MAGMHFPNETDEYRARRDELLELEKEQRALGVAVAEKRQLLPLGGRLKQDYRFERVGSDGEIAAVGFGDLFGEHDSLLLYTMMFGRDWDAPCPSCTSLVDGFNSAHNVVSQRAGFAVVADATARQIHDWTARRGWSAIPVYSATDSAYILDYFPHPETDDPALVAMMNVFHRTPEGIFHTWGAELVAHVMDNGHPRHVDPVWLYWNLLDMTREGRGDHAIPVQDFEHAYFSENVFREPE